MLDVIPADVLVGRLGLTGAQGGPLCARVEPLTSPGPPHAPARSGSGPM
ncbi:DUF5990 family protein [Streptomyces sp. NBC_00443]